MTSLSLVSVDRRPRKREAIVVRIARRCGSRRRNLDPGPSVASEYNATPGYRRTFGPVADGGVLAPGISGAARRELFVTGRLKELIIIRGVNHYPQDIERTVEQAVRQVRPGCCSAFALDRLGEELAAILPAVDSASGTSLERLAEAVDAIRRQVIEAHSIAPAAVVFVAAGSLAKTTSGKLQRYACRDAFLAGTLDVVSHWIDGGPIGALEKAAS